MRSGAQIAEILENFLAEKKLSRRQFCALVDIPSSTIGMWKLKNSYPSIELASRIAQFMNVSLDWLINGEICPGYENSEAEPTYPKLITNRLYQLISEQNDYHSVYGYNKEFHDLFLKDIVDYESFFNWDQGRAVLPLSTFVKLAEKANVSLQYLLTGKDSDKSFETELELDSYRIKRLYEKYKYAIWNLDTLDEESRKLCLDQIANTAELKRRREGRE